MSPAFIPTIKELMSHLTQAKAEKILQRALKLKTTAQVIRLMEQQIAETRAMSRSSHPVKLFSLIKTSDLPAIAFFPPPSV